MFGPSDVELIQRLKQGDKSALTILFDRYYRLVLSVANKVLGDASEAEDTMQEIFLKIYQAASQYDPERGNPKVWILQFAYYHSLDRRRRLKTRNFYDLAELNEVDAAFVSHTGWNSVAGTETRRIVQEALEALNDKERRTIELAHYDGLNMHEIAERTGETYAAIRHQYYRAMKKLYLVLSEPQGKKEALTKPKEAIDAGT
jgi:RNA polymerase sigma-70 factor (ECF subfamily)